MNLIMVNFFNFFFQNLVVLKDERDSAIRGLYVKLNLGSIPNSPFSDEVALNLTNQIEVRLMELDKDLDEKKVVFVLL